ncbi:hypothetical protein JW877_01635 [bacterium]|nr:hypothetical protein [bacterium]
MNSEIKIIKKYLLNLFIIIFVPLSVFGWSDCPLGKTECDIKCPLFVDVNNDGICDHSQPDPGIPEGISEVAQLSEDEGVYQRESVNAGKDGIGHPAPVPPEIITPIADPEPASGISPNSKIQNIPIYEAPVINLSQGKAGGLREQAQTGLKEGAGPNSRNELKAGPNSSLKRKRGKSEYHLLPILLGLMLLYFLSYILSRKGVYRKATHRKIWNLLLLLTFLFMSILGILLILQVNFGILTNTKFNMLFWHVEVGIAMFAIAIFHLVWHLNYFKCYFKTGKSKSCETAE